MAQNLAMVMFGTATLRSGFLLQDCSGLAGRNERMLKLSLNINLEEQVNAIL